MPDLNGQLSQEAYERWHDQLEVDDAADAPWHDLIRKHLDPARDLDGKRVLEIGCGRGGFSCWIASQPTAPRELVAADFSSVAVAKGKAFADRQGLGNITWIEADIQKIPFPNASFDTVFSCETVEHVPDPQLALRELARVLKPGGTLFLTTPNYLGTMGLYRLYLRLTGRRFTEGGQPINQLTWLPRTQRWLRRAGLLIRSSDTSGHYLPVPGRPPIRVHGMDALPIPVRGFGLHSLTTATKR